MLRKGLWSRSPSQKGFTLIEAVAAVAILVILGSALTMTSMPLINYYKNLQTRVELNELNTALRRYAVDFGGFPPTIRDLLEPRGGSANLLWRGPYVARTREDYTRDAWNSLYSYQVGAVAISGTQVAGIVAPGRNRGIDTFLSSFQQLDWNIRGDDLGLRPTLSGIQWETMLQTRHSLRVIRGNILNDFPRSAPATYDTSVYRDGWNMPIRYRFCNNFGAVIYSYGPNRIDDSAGGIVLCTAAQAPGNDDWYLYIVWERSGH